MCGSYGWAFGVKWKQTRPKKGASPEALASGKPWAAAVGRPIYHDNCFIDYSLRRLHGILFPAANCGPVLILFPGYNLLPKP
jgi:hypothetical protein